MNWSDEELSIAKEAILNSIPASKIGPLIGRTRNAVIGKMNRIKFGFIIKPGDNLRRSSKPKKPRRPKAISRRPKLPPIAQDEYESAEQHFVRVASRPKRLLKLKPHDCRWPLWATDEPMEFFCGAPVIEGLPYCREHCMHAYTPTAGLRYLRKKYEVTA